MAAQLTRLATDKVHPERVNLYLDGEFLDSISAELVYRYHLRVGMTLSDELIDEIRREEALEQAKLAAFNYLRIRNRTSREMRLYLMRKGISPYLIEHVLQFLAEQKLLDDSSFAVSYVNQRLQTKPRGRRLIRYELSQKGVSSQDIEQALANAKISDLDAAIRLVQKRLSSFRDDKRAEWIMRTFRWLISKGFSHSVAKQAIENILAANR